MKKVSLLVLLNLLMYTLLFSQGMSTSGPYGGFMGELVKTENTLIASAGNGGVYKSIDNGQTWEKKTTGLPTNGTVYDLVSNNGTIYASVFNNGIYLSTDEAENWTAINNEVEDLTFYNFMVNENDIYAGNANGGVYYSEDNGSNWTEKSDGIADIQFEDFAYFKSAVYAGGSSLFRSTNSGNSWEEIEITGLDANGVRSMTATENSLIVGDNGNIFVSSDGISWNKSTLNVNASILNMGVSGDSIYLTTSVGRFYYSKDEGLNWVLVQNTETDQFVRDIELLDNAIIMSTSEGIYSSYDNGNEWVNSNQGLQALEIESLASNGTYIFAGTERQGIFRYDTESNWTKMNFGLDALNAKSIHNIVIVGDDVFIGTGGGVYRSSNFGTEWSRISDLGTSTLDFDNGKFVLGSGGTGIYVSSDTAKTFVLSENNGLNIETGYESILLQGDTVVVSTRNGEMFLSQDLGHNWTDVSITGDYYMTYDLHYSNDRLYAATSKGLLFSENLGESWAFLNNEYLSISGIAMAGKKVYAATKNGLFVTSETREKWYHVSGELGNSAVNEIILTSDKIYAGTFASSVWELPILEANLPPIILSQEPIISDEDTELSIPLDKLIVDDENTYPENFTFAVKSGDNYSVSTNIIIPDENFNGILNVPISINDGIDNSPVFDLTIEVSPINDAPVVVAYKGPTNIAGDELLEVSLSDLTVNDVDNDFPDDFSLSVLEGDNYQLTENQIRPNTDFVGDLTVPVKVNDGDIDSEALNITISVTAILSINNRADKPKFSIFPNPSNNYLKINSDMIIESNQIRILNLEGKLSKTVPMKTEVQNNVIDISSIPAGIYLIQISIDDDVSTVKFIKQ
ncbi:Por secretion system C-terminal sorting domain-containing protein [Marivirga sericea]|uniref:Por secretion system C-terminal sorting domain-containing protein n=1 Tax=Marivirga sericea TaxID=1028 RepID=A0A1X7I6P7_9BACT|nr:T9SS type A sorting domain-containing protein [Marivirga sericea]SMG09973.1 Por secretion system C-terminal sorting domain-containing protein [Marivirga sericea]